MTAATVDPYMPAELREKLARQDTLARLYREMCSYTMRCPHNQCQLRDGPMGVVVNVTPDYPTVLYWECKHCGGRWHKWPEGHPHRARAAAYVGTP